MKHIWIFLIFFLYLLTGCSSFKIATTNHTPKVFVTTTGINVDVIDSEFSLYRKFNRDNKFRWNYTTFALNQDLNWYYSFYRSNFLFRYRYNFTPWDLYVNRYDFWFDWNFNYGWRGFNHWDPYGFKRWGWNSWNPYFDNYPLWNRNNIAYVNGRRGSTYYEEKNDIITRKYDNIRTRISNNSGNNVRIYSNPEDKIISRRELNDNKVLNRYIQINRNNNNSNNNDQLKKFDTRSYGRPEIDNNGRGFRSREVLPSTTAPTRFTPPSQSGQVRGGSQPPVVRQTSPGNSSSGPRSRGPR